jgi:hypothetical protein
MTLKTSCYFFIYKPLANVNISLNNNKIKANTKLSSQQSLDHTFKNEKQRRATLHVLKNFNEHQQKSNIPLHINRKGKHPRSKET